VGNAIWNWSARRGMVLKPVLHVTDKLRRKVQNQREWPEPLHRLSASSGRTLESREPGGSPPSNKPYAVLGSRE
jgi:hypothetical protein